MDESIEIFTESPKPFKTTKPAKKTTKPVKKTRKKRQSTTKSKKDDTVINKKGEAGEVTAEDPKKVIKTIPRPIFEEDRKERIKYCKKRMMFCNGEKVKSYQNHIDKLMLRPLIVY